MDDTLSEFFKFTDKILCQYLYLQSVSMNFPVRLTGRNDSSKKLSSIICGMSVSLSITILLMTLLGKKKHAEKKNYLLYYASISSMNINISPT